MSFASLAQIVQDAIEQEQEDGDGENFDAITQLGGAMSIELSEIGSSKASSAWHSLQTAALDGDLRAVVKNWKTIKKEVNAKLERV